jgi:hypothetical protein
VSSLAKKVEKRLIELRANAWVLVDYRMQGLVKFVGAVQVLPMQCTIEIVPVKTIES